MIKYANILKPCGIAVYVVKFEQNEWLFLMLRRSSNYLKGTWQMVTGGLENGEKAWQGALREVFEETGLKPKKMYSADTLEAFYDLGRDLIMLNPCFVAFIEDDQEVILSPHEHDAYEWVSYQQALVMVEFQEQRRILTHVYDCLLMRTPSPWLLVQQ